MPALVNIEGIGEKYAEKLAKAKIGSTQTLLKRGSTRKGRQEIAEQAGIDSGHILDWVNRADLFRIRGIGEEYSDLLEATGVDTVPELAQRNPDHLCRQLADTNGKKKLVRRVPNMAEVKSWVTQAKKLPRVVRY